MSKVLIITYEHKTKTGDVVDLCSHGVDTETLEQVVLPPEQASSVGDYYCRKLGGWVIE